MAGITLSIVLASCASGPGGSTAPVGHPAGDALILRIEYSGGFAGPAFTFTSLPWFTLSGDGRVIVQGAQIAIFPGPALPAVNVRRLTEAGIQSVLAEVARTALFGASVAYQGARNCVMDAGDTVFSLHADGRDVKVTAYGLGTLDPAGGCPGISAAELAAYQTLQRLNDRLTNLEAWLPAAAWAEPSWRPYQPTALRLLVRNADADPPDGSGIANQLLHWPGDSNPATFGDPIPLGDQRCGVVTGQPAHDWLASLSGTNQLTRFVKNGHRYEVTVRFLLPDEPPACAKPAA